MTRKYSHERKKRVDERDKFRNYAPLDEEDDDDDVNELEIEQIKVDTYKEYNPFKKFVNNYKDIIGLINSFRTIGFDVITKRMTVKINNIDIITKKPINSELDTKLHLMTNRKDVKTKASIYKGVSSKEIKTTLRLKFEEFFQKYIGTSVSTETMLGYNIIPLKITPSAVSNFYNYLVRSYNMEEEVFRRFFYTPFEDLFTLDDIDLMLSVGVLVGKKYYFRIPTRISNNQIYEDIETIYDNKSNYEAYFNLFKFFRENKQYTLSILLFIDSFHDFSKKASGGKDKLLQTEINNILKIGTVAKDSTIMTYYKNKMFEDKQTFIFPENTILSVLNELDNKKRRNIFEILENVCEKILGTTFEKKFLYLYVYYFFIDKLIPGTDIKTKLDKFKKEYTFDITENPKQLINLDEPYKYTQDFLMKNESYRVDKKPVHFAINNSKNSFTFIPASLMDANKSNSSKDPTNYMPFLNNELQFEIFPINLSYTYYNENNNCNLGVFGQTADKTSINKFLMSASQNCKGDKDPLEYDKALSEYENNNKNTVAKKRIYELNDNLRDIENTLLDRFNLKDINQLSENYILFSNGSDGISRGDVLSLILTFSHKLSKLNKPLTIQLLDRLLTLKRLGDFGQIMNCKQLDIPLFTQDSMENLLAIATNTQTIFGNNPRYIYFNGYNIISNRILKKRIIEESSETSIKRSRNFSPPDEIYNNKQINKEIINYYKTNSREVDNQLREYNILYNKIIKNVSFSSNISKWLESRFNQIFVNSLITSSCLKSLNTNHCNELEVEIITKVLKRYLQFLYKIELISENENIDNFTLYLFMKYDLYDIINNFTGGYKTSTKTKYATSILLETVLLQILNDLDKTCDLNNIKDCKNIDDYLNDYKSQLKQDVNETDYKNEEDYYNNTFNQFKNKNYLIANKIRSRKTYHKSIIKSSRDNIRKSQKKRSYKR